jgi:hypothetical protein
MEVHIVVQLEENMERRAHNGGAGSYVVIRLQKLSSPEVEPRTWAGKRFIRIWRVLQCLQHWRAISSEN